MTIRSTLLGSLCILSCASSAGALDLTGTWQVRSIAGAEDAMKCRGVFANGEKRGFASQFATAIEISQSGDTVLARMVDALFFEEDLEGIAHGQANNPAKGQAMLQSCDTIGGGVTAATLYLKSARTFPLKPTGVSARAVIDITAHFPTGIEAIAQCRAKIERISEVDPGVTGCP